MPEKKILVAPSILSADFRRLEAEVKKAEECGADRIHCDVMDGHFVPNLTFGPFVIAAVKQCVSLPIDVHLMIANPQDHIAAYCKAGADILTVHAEVCPDLPSIASEIRRHGARPGVSVNPDKRVDLFIPHLSLFDQVLIMSVYAGFSGQAFIPDILPKVKVVYEAAQQRHLSLDIEIDGGINHDTARLAAENGANAFVAGNYVFKAADYRSRIGAIRNAADEAWKKRR
jgi:ribulose-phosphate 3-epimerase